MHPKRYIITGGPGSGKTTLVENLHILGFHTRKEAARKIIEWNLEHDGTILPWIDRDAFDRQVFEISRKDYLETEDCAVAFFDGCMLDIVPWRRYLKLKTQEFVKLVDEYAFEKEVFIPAPREDIHFSDAARPFAFSDGVAITQKIAEFYTEHKFRVIYVPHASPKDAAKFVLETLQLIPRDCA